MSRGDYAGPRSRQLSSLCGGSTPCSPSSFDDRRIYNRHTHIQAAATPLHEGRYRRHRNPDGQAETRSPGDVRAREGRGPGKVHERARVARLGATGRLRGYRHDGGKRVPSVARTQERVAGRHRPHRRGDRERVRQLETGVDVRRRLSGAGVRRGVHTREQG